MKLYSEPLLIPYEVYFKNLSVLELSVSDNFL